MKMNAADRTQPSVSPKDRENLDEFVERILKIPGMPVIQVDELAKRPADYFRIAAEGCQMAIKAEGVHMSGSALGIYVAFRTYAERKAAESKGDAQ
jgi:hypothetical protein